MTTATTKNKFYHVANLEDARKMAKAGFANVIAGETRSNKGTQEVGFAILEIVRLHGVKLENNAVLQLDKVGRCWAVRQKLEQKGGVDVRVDSDQAKEYRRAIQSAVIGDKPTASGEGMSEMLRKALEAWNTRRAIFNKALELAELVAYQHGTEYLFSEVKKCFQIDASNMVPNGSSLLPSAQQIKNKVFDWQVDLDNTTAIRFAKDGSDTETRKRCNFTNYVAANRTKSATKTTKMTFEDACDLIAKWKMQEHPVSRETYDKVTAARHVLTLVAVQFEKAHPEVTNDQNKESAAA